MKQIAAAALVAGLATGSGMSAYTLSEARFGDDHGVEYVAGSYTRYAGNQQATQPSYSQASATACTGCSDSYEIVYHNTPDRYRDGIRIVDDPWADSGAQYAAASYDDWDAPAETGWGNADDYDGTVRTADTRRTIDESLQRIEAIRRQVETSAVQTAEMVAPVKVYRGNNVAVQNAAPAPVATAVAGARLISTPN